LEGIRVLDFGQVYNGPYCGFLLAQAGARVIKVESLQGETLRARGEATAATYPLALLNAGKECITINLKHPDGQALVKRLAREVDVVLENFAPGTMDKHGVGSSVLRGLNPRLVYAAGTGYGSVGPYRDYLGMDITLQAMTGVMSITGEAQGPPMKTAATFVDFNAGTHLYGAIVTALFARERSGAGATVDISMQDCTFPPLATALGSYYQKGEQQPRSGNRHPGQGLAPYNVYEAADGHVAIICIREGHWRRLCMAMDAPELLDDERFATNAARCAHIDAVDERVNQWTRSLPKADIVRVAQAQGVICAPVQTLREVVDDPHLAARGTLEVREHPQLGPIAQCHTPIRFQDIDPPPLADVPTLGSDTARVLAELAGVDAAEFARLRAADAV
jgi:crotonobetainyl-CoA:carnitine CoA-transferase CaiB-like acyl-CoA transferase